MRGLVAIIDTDFAVNSEKSNLRNLESPIVGWECCAFRSQPALAQLDCGQLTFAEQCVGRVRELSLRRREKFSGTALGLPDFFYNNFRVRNQNVENAAVSQELNWITAAGNSGFF